MTEEISKWVANHSLAVQAFAAAAGVLLTVVLVVTTIIYVRITKRILEESRKAREASEKQAAASQENLQLLKNQLESQLGLGPQIAREAILDTKRLITYWMEEARRIGHRLPGAPDPGLLAASTLVGVVENARKISDECVQLILEAHANLRNAKSEFEKAAPATMHQTTVSLGAQTKAIAYLQVAGNCLDRALAMVSEHIKERRPNG